MKAKKFWIALIVIVVLALYLSVYTVREGQSAVVLKLGKLVTAKNGMPLVIKPGLHFKTPFISSVQKFDTRLQTLDVQSSRVLTEEQKYLLVDYYVKWKIQDLALYYVRTGGYVDKTETLLQQKINDALRAAFGKRTITEVVSGERGSVMDLLQQRAEVSAKDLGVEVVDVRIKRIDLPEEVSSSVFDRMRVEREQAAAKHRSDGKAAAEAIRAQADAAVTVTLAKARETGAKIRAAGDSKAAKIYTDAYSRNVEFYNLYRSLKAYREAFNNKSDILLLQPNSEFFKYFQSTNNQHSKS